ncbi:hypothetical protein T05_15432 [Trichinella murrelli]|uniref:Uncharacterized protein n=1 Tax=Trichinella murrelli TaxID=144512 RepID=A0A0V0UH58_9BILA|nr:hypothetical protein T05_15432 [Trichinella murrelli]
MNFVKFCPRHVMVDMKLIFALKSQPYANFFLFMGKLKLNLIALSIFQIHLVVHIRITLAISAKDGKMTGVLLSRFRCRSIPFPADGQFY